MFHGTGTGIPGTVWMIFGIWDVFEEKASLQCYNGYSLSTITFPTYNHTSSGCIYCMLNGFGGSSFHSLEQR